MQLPRTDDPPDEGLAADLMQPLLVASVVLVAVLAGLLLTWGWQGLLWLYALVGVFGFLVWMAARANARGKLRLAGGFLSAAYALAPVLTVPALGIAQNPLVFVAPLGILLAALTMSPRAPLLLAGAAWLLAVTTVLLARVPLQMALPALTTLTLLLLGTAVLSWLAAAAIRGTINWALEAATKSARREALLRETQRDLEQTLRERDCLNEALSQANRSLEFARAAAETAYRSKTSFMAAMSHELRTPLNLIIGFSSALLEHPEMYGDRPLLEAHRTDIAEIRRSGRHLLALINDILDLSKVEAGHLELNKRPLLLPPLLDEVLRTAQGLFANRPVVLRSDCPETLPVVLADEVRVRQVLLNLLSNANKFTGSGEVVVGAETDDENVILWVRDTGIGIAREDQARIFREFEQVEPQEAIVQTGTGLGLAICRWLVELHGGRIWVESEPGQGSTFSFSLRCAPVMAECVLPDVALQALEIGG